MVNKLNYSLILVVLVFVLNLNSFGQGSLDVLDTRDAVTTPSTYSRSFQTHLKFATSIGVERAFPNIFYTVLGIRGWSDDTGGKGQELAFSNDNRLLIRSGYNADWEGWRSVLISSTNGFYGLGTSSPKEIIC